MAGNNRPTRIDNLKAREDTPNQTKTREELRELETSGQFRKHLPSTDNAHQTGKHHSDATKSGTSGKNLGKDHHVDKGE